MTLYQKIQTGKTVRYKPYVPEPPKRSEFSDKELITLAASVGIMVLMECRRLKPDKSFVDTRVKAVEEAILKMTKGAGGPLDRELVEYWGSVWDKTMTEFAKGVTP